MSAPKENRFWMARSTHGRDKIFESPEILWEASLEYFQWVKDNPLKSSEVIKTKDGAELFEVPLMRAMTIEGLCIFLDIDTKTFHNYSEKEEYKDFFPITTRIREIIRTQKFEGSAANLLNANIIARDLNLVDKTSNEVTGNLNISPKKWVKNEPKDRAE